MGSVEKIYAWYGMNIYHARAQGVWGCAFALVALDRLHGANAGAGTERASVRASVRASG
jgi:hypothetical protein